MPHEFTTFSKKKKEVEMYARVWLLLRLIEANAQAKRTKFIRIRSCTAAATKSRTHWSWTKRLHFMRVDESTFLFFRLFAISLHFDIPWVALPSSNGADAVVGIYQRNVLICVVECASVCAIRWSRSPYVFDENLLFAFGRFSGSPPLLSPSFSFLFHFDSFVSPITATEANL